MEKFSRGTIFFYTNLKIILRPWADSNHRSPVYKTGALTAMLQSHIQYRHNSKIKESILSVTNNHNYQQLKNIEKDKSIVWPI